MNRAGFLFATFAVLAAAVSCGTAVQQDDDRIKVILETDIGNDVDDALALDMLHKYIDDGTVDVLAIMINKNGEAPAEFTDIMRGLGLRVRLCPLIVFGSCLQFMITGIQTTSYESRTIIKNKDIC